MAYSMGEGFKQSQLEVFEKNYIRVAQQTDSKLLHTPAIQFIGELLSPLKIMKG